MKRWGGPAWMAGGAALGVLATAVLLGAITLPFGLKTPSFILDRLPTPVLARVLMGQATGDLVADSRAKFPLEHGATFYGQPRRTSGFLCAVTVYGVNKNRRGPPSLSAQDAYAIWSDPSDAAAMTNDALGKRSEQACANYRDFDHLVADDPEGGTWRSLQWIDLARDQAVAGTLTAKVTCVSRHETRDGKPCDGLAMLRGLDLKKISGTETITTEWTSARGSDASFKIWIDEGYLHGHPAVTFVTITGLSAVGTRAEQIFTIEIEQEVF